MEREQEKRKSVCVEVNIDKKLSLAKQLGLRRQISNIEYHKRMFDLKFKPITLFQIRKKLGIHFFSRRILRWCWVDDFRYEIPYGAMLALKEAGNAGILHHRIYYPVLFSFAEYFSDMQEKFISSLDPVITGIDRQGRMVEIFSWNEDDIYEK